MIWSKIDFEREVRRQLVELESIRKRVPANAEIHQRIDKLEVSHKNILRKLAELFPQTAPSPSAASPNAASPNVVRSAANSHRSVAASPAVRAHAQKAIERYLRTVEQTARLRKLICGDRLSVRTLLGVESSKAISKKELPSLDTKCATCGKVLISGILGGEEVLFLDNAWHHRECIGDPTDGGSGFSKPGMLN